MSLEQAITRLAEAIEAQNQSGQPNQAAPLQATAPSPEEKQEEPPKPKGRPKKVKKEDKPEYKRLAEGLTGVINAYGGKANRAIEILKEYGVEKATEAPEDKWSEIADKIEAAIEEATPDQEEEKESTDLI